MSYVIPVNATELVRYNDKFYKLCPECRSSQPMGITCDRNFTTMYCCRCGMVVKEVKHFNSGAEVTIDRTASS